MTVSFVGGAAMADGSLQGPTNPHSIDIHSPAELRHWVREIGRPAAQIKQAVLAVGTSVSDVRAFLQRRGLYQLR